MFSQIISAGKPYGVALFLGFAIAFVYVAIVAPITYPFRFTDSSYYLEAARNYMAGNGLTTSTGLGRWPVDREPLSLWPPGFPMIVALGSTIIGADPAWLAPKITWLAWALIPVALVFALRPVLRSWHVHIIGVIVMLSPGIVEYVEYALTDITFLFFTIVWLGLLYRGTENGTQPILLVSSGIVCALAYATRNVGIAAFVAVTVAYASLVFLKLISLKAALQRLAWWGVGASLIVVPLLVWNLSAFGVLQPYQMSPSQVGFLTNTRYFLAASINYVFASPGLLDMVLWSGALSVTPWVGILILIWLMRSKIYQAWNSLALHEKEMLSVAVAYVMAGAAVVIVARSKYQWGEFIGLRHVMQYHWILFCVCAVFLARWVKMPRWALVCIAGVTLVIVGLRFVNLSYDVELRRSEFAISERISDTPVDQNSLHYRMHAMQLLVARDRQLIQAIKDMPSTTVLVSNLSELLRVETGRPVYWYSAPRDCDLTRRFDIFTRGDSQPKRAALLLFPTLELIRSGCWARLENSTHKRLALDVTRPYLISLDALALAAGR